MEQSLISDFFFFLIYDNKILKKKQERDEQTLPEFDFRLQQYMYITLKICKSKFILSLKGLSLY